MVEVMKIMATSFKRSLAGTATLSAPSTAAGYCQRPPPLETPGPSWGSPCQSLVRSLLLFLGSWCTQGFFFVPSKSLFSQSCVISGRSMLRLMVTSSKRARSTAPRAL